MKKSISLLVARPFCFSASQRGTKKKRTEKRIERFRSAYKYTHTKKNIYRRANDVEKTYCRVREKKNTHTANKATRKVVCT